MIQLILSKLLTILVFLIIFTIIVVSHEFGHFLLGRLNGIKVNEFAIGMGPVIFKKKLKSTVLCIHLLPIGGACVFESDDLTLGLPDDESNADNNIDNNIENNIDNNIDNNVDGNIDSIGNYNVDSSIKDNIDKLEYDIENTDITSSLPGDKFQNAPIWGRIATVLAGPFFNFILAYLLCLFMVWFCGQDLPVVADVADGYPAKEAGLLPGDTILKINNHKVYLFREISLETLMNNGEDIDIVYERDGQKYSTVITPKYVQEEDRYYIGLSGGKDYVKCNNLSVFKYSYVEVRYWLIATYKSLGYLFSGHGSMDDVSGPVGVATVIDDTIETTSSYGVFTVILNLINITVLLCVNLGVINLLPFPAIDGGRLLFLLYELITKKKVPADKEGLVHLIGIIILFIFMIIVFFNDIWRIVSKFL